MSFDKKDKKEILELVSPIIEEMRDEFKEYQENMRKEFKEDRESLKIEFRKAQSENTEKFLQVLNAYEKKQEKYDERIEKMLSMLLKHDRNFGKIKDIE